MTVEGAEAGAAGESVPQEERGYDIRMPAAGMTLAILSADLSSVEQRGTCWEWEMTSEMTAKRPGLLGKSWFLGSKVK